MEIARCFCRLVLHSVWVHSPHWSWPVEKANFKPQAAGWLKRAEQKGLDMPECRKHTQNKRDVGLWTGHWIDLNRFHTYPGPVHRGHRSHHFVMDPVHLFCGLSWVASQNGFRRISDIMTQCARPPFIPPQNWQNWKSRLVIPFTREPGHRFRSRCLFNSASPLKCAWPQTTHHSDPAKRVFFSREKNQKPIW